MNRFNDDEGGEVARKMKLAGDKILRPMILKWIDRLKDRNFRSLMDIGGNEATWNTNPQKYLELYFIENYKQSRLPARGRAMFDVDTICSQHRSPHLWRCGHLAGSCATLVQITATGGTKTAIINIYII